MREIKFRAWDIEFGNMIEWPRFQKYTGLFTNPEYVVMQYTGLKDRNGVEIYEGDVLKVNELTFRSSWSLPENLNVKYCGGMFQLFRGRETLMGLHLGYLEDGEVIGNIYENPELIP